MIDKLVVEWGSIACAPTYFLEYEEHQDYMRDIHHYISAHFGIRGSILEVALTTHRSIFSEDSSPHSFGYRQPIICRVRCRY